MTTVLMRTVLLPVAMLLAVPAHGQSAGLPAQALAENAGLPARARAAGAVVDAFHAALGRGDTKAVVALLADDAVIYESGGVERSKAEYASHHLAADAAFARVTTRTVSRRTGDADGRTAWIASEGATKGTYKTRAINSVGTETMVLRRGNAGWRIVHVHWSSANAK